MAFMARLRTAADESRLALRITFMSRLRPVRRKCKRAAAVSAGGGARRGRNGGFLTLSLALCRTPPPTRGPLRKRQTQEPYGGTPTDQPHSGVNKIVDRHEL